jgi:hypothetical protein
MVRSIPTSGIRDNHSRGVVADFLKSHVKEGSRLSIVSAFFTIYAYEALKDHLNRIGHMDFLFGEPRFIRSLDHEQAWSISDAPVREWDGIGYGDCWPI